MIKKVVSALVAVLLFTAPALAQTTAAPPSPSVEPATPAAPAKTTMKKKAKHPAKRATRHAKPKAPAEEQPAGSDQD
jgi:hypothetical protein